MALMNAAALREELANRLPALWRSISEIADKWMAPILANLDSLDDARIAFPKTFTDPVLGPIELFEWEVAILDSPLLQRLRGVRQLGMAHAVYTGASHDRLSHTLGVVEVAQRMMDALVKNASYHRNYGSDIDPVIPLLGDDDRYSIRLAALLHDIGHGPFSHASESLMEQALPDEFESLRSILREQFPGAEKVFPSEAVAVLLILSGQMSNVFAHAHFRVVFSRKDVLPICIVARLLGSRREVQADYLSKIVSGPIDADKLDYMARDSYFTGLPLGLDVDRLINKLEVITITPDKVTEPTLVKRAQEAKNSRLYQLGISVAGITAFEQMIIGRVLLYDRVYYHHKVRCAEAMVRILFRTAATERGVPFSLDELLTDMSDDSMVYMLNTVGVDSGNTKNGTHTKLLAARIRGRRFYHRAFAFAERFLSGIQGSKNEQHDTRIILWQHVMDSLGDENDWAEFGTEIFLVAQRLRHAIPDLNSAHELHEHDIIVDMTEKDPVPTSSREVFMRTEGGELTYAELFFNPDKWSEAYKNQKKCGYIFAPRHAVKVVALAAKIRFFEKFGVIMGPQTRHICKLEGVSPDTWRAWLAAAATANICSPECVEALSEQAPRLIQFREENFKFPAEWLAIEGNFAKRLAKEFSTAFGTGFTASMHEAIIGNIEHLSAVLQAFEERGEFVDDDRPNEKLRLQREIAKALAIRRCAVREGQELGGGETDLILPGEIVMENKVAELTNDLATLKPSAPWQARRYSIALNRRVFFTAIAYKPGSEALLLPVPKRVSVFKLPDSPEEAVCVRFLIPWGVGVPSMAKPPRATPSAENPN